MSSLAALPVHGIGHLVILLYLGGSLLDVPWYSVADAIRQKCYQDYSSFEFLIFVIHCGFLLGFNGDHYVSIFFDGEVDGVSGFVCDSHVIVLFRVFGHGQDVL